MTTRETIVQTARQWKGVKWRHQGRSRLGIDCAGLIACVAAELNEFHHDVTNYPRRSHSTTFLAHFKAHMNEKRVDRLYIGDVGIFAEPRFPCHCGIISEKYGVFYLIHAHISRRKVVEERLAPFWLDKLTNVFEFPGVSDG
jgi:hypothetical protein